MFSFRKSPPEEAGRTLWNRRPAHLVTAAVVIAIVVVLGATRVGRSVVLPVLFAIFGFAVLAPLQARLERRLPRMIAALASWSVAVAFLGAIAGGIAYGAHAVADYAKHHRDAFDRLAQSSVDALHGAGVDIAALKEGPLRAFARSVFGSTASAAVAIALTLALLLLMLFEHRQIMRGRALLASRPRGRRLLLALRFLGRDLRLYVLVRTGVGVMTGVLCFAGTEAIGLELALVWGLTNFLLNYIPTVGSVLGVAPPVLFAAAMHDPMTALLVLVVVGGVQLVMGSTIDPLIQGHYLSLSATVVLAVVVFWGWLWGSAGALLAVPVTLAVVRILQVYPRTRPFANWIAGRAPRPWSTPRNRLDAEREDRLRHAA